MGAPKNDCKAAGPLGTTGRQRCTGSIEGFGWGQGPQEVLLIFLLPSM